MRQLWGQGGDGFALLGSFRCHHNGWLAAIMNRLKKPRPSEPSPAADASNASVMSRTMQLAVGGMKITSDSSLQRRGTWFSAPLDSAPHTKVEQYWAARALVAETLLSARDQHQAELAEVQRTEAQKREVSFILPVANDADHCAEIPAGGWCYTTRQRSEAE